MLQVIGCGYFFPINIRVLSEVQQSQKNEAGKCFTIVENIWCSNLKFLIKNYQNNV